MQTLVLGIDAGCLPVLSSLFADGELGHLQEVVDGGVSGSLESQIPPWTPSAWPSLYTGTNPGKHGVFDFLSFDGYDWEVVNASHICERSLWELLSLRGYSSVVVNVPVTHPPHSFDGALVPGYTAPEDPTCHPTGLLADVRDAIGDYRVYPREAASFDDPLDRYREVVEQRGEAFRYLSQEYDPDFGFLQFQQTDTVFHERPGDEEAVRAVYAAVDEQFGAVLDACAPANVFVVSDHGIGRYDDYEFRVNEYLREEGYLATRNGGRGMPSWSTVYDEHLREGQAVGRYEGGLLDRATRAVARVGFTRQRVESLLEAVGLAKPVGRRLPTGMVEAGAEQVDFPASTAYMRSRSELGVRINLEGRDPEGTVSPTEYETVRAGIIELLDGVRTPDGDSVFEDVAPREEYFRGPAADQAVDIVTVPSGFDQLLSARLSGEIFGSPTQSWNHKLDGIIAARGRDVDAGASLDGAHLLDVAPTILATFGIRADERMDGDVLPIVEPVGSQSYPRYERGASVPTADPAVEQRLADMGYLER